MTRPALLCASCRAHKHGPDDVYTLDSRSFYSLKLGEFDAAIDGYNAGLKVNPKLAHSLYDQGLAKRKQGDASGAESDIAAAKAISAGIVGEFRHFRID